MIGDQVKRHQKTHLRRGQRQSLDSRRKKFLRAHSSPAERIFQSQKLWFRFPINRLATGKHQRHSQRRTNPEKDRAQDLTDYKTSVCFRGFVSGYLQRRSEEHTSELQSLAYLVC